MLPTEASSVAAAHARSLAAFEGRRFCSRAEAARYLDISESKLDELLYAQEIRSQYLGRLRKVVIASLLEYVDKRMSVDRPGGAR